MDWNLENNNVFGRFATAGQTLSVPPALTQNIVVSPETAVFGRMFEQIGDTVIFGKVVVSGGTLETLSFPGKPHCFGASSGQVGKKNAKVGGQFRRWPVKKT